MKNNKLIAYALDFTSYLIENDIKINRAILFGSVVTEQFDNESDVDIFIETNEKEETIQKLLNQFEKTKGENWKLKGIENQISLKVGSLKKWPQLQRSIQSHGLLLYGEYKEVPDNINSYVLFIVDYGGLKRAEKVNVWRKLYGYSQKVKDKQYTTVGLVSKLNGKKLKEGVIEVPSKNAKELKDFFNKNKIKYKIIEIWSDSLE